VSSDTTNQPEQACLRILAADDNATNRLVLKALLKKTGADLTIVENGQEAFDTWNVCDFDLILMDIKMPVMDGVTAVLKIREAELRQNRKRTPIIAVTANALPEQAREYLIAGMNAVVAKPICQLTLLESIEQAAVEVRDDQNTTQQNSA
jgi:CheY-like chemotaxis protein